MNSPYVGLGRRSYWRTGVVDRHALSMGDIYVKKFTILPDENIATAGSCFAQHIAIRLRQNHYNVLDTEQGPSDLPNGILQSYGFRLYSARYGNVYTVRQMLQLTQEAYGQRSPEDVVWEKDKRFYDALRPTVEPQGLSSAELVMRHRYQHLFRVKQLLNCTSLFIFTMGLTETWEHLEDGTVYPTAPGTIAGSYDVDKYRFKNLNYEENLSDFLLLREMLKKINPEIRFLLTVSPVPLTATAGNEHVVAATTYSKSVLRAVAGYLAQTFGDIDYFPSYEIISGIQARSQFYENNLRSVASAGVDLVMRSFLDQHLCNTNGVDAKAKSALLSSEEEERQRVYCEEALLEAFAND